VYKPSPVNEKIAPVVQRVFAPLVDHPSGPFLGFALGGPEIGAQLINHPIIQGFTLTGGIATYNRIKWGNNTEKKGTPAYTKPIRAELGGVNPVIYVPGKWSASELEAHAQQLVATRMVNGGHVCACSQVYITSRQWPQREQFAARVKELLQSYPGTHTFYPNITPAYRNQESGNPNIAPVTCEKLFDSQVAPLFAVDCPQDCEAVKTEAFCPVLVEVALDTADPEQFLKEAVEFANSKVNGTLCATLVVDGATHKRHKQAVDEAIDKLEFGSVGLNQPGMIG
jgi:acyl-CoA reductase-like NAD-dependent aldehyde dehydrogenase